MGKTTFSLYLESQGVVDEYEDRAFIELGMNGEIPCCLGIHPKETRYYGKLKKRAQELFALDKSK